jgi:outer membrane protein TolC
MAQSGAPPLVLTLEDAIQRGLAASRRIDEAGARQDAADAVAGQRRAAALPQLNVLASYTRTNHVDEFGVLMPTGQLRVIYPDVPDNYGTRLDMSWPLYTGGRLERLERAARQESAAAAADVDALRADVRLEITRAFWALVVARESQRVIDESLVRTRAHVGDVRSALDAGLVPPNDVLTAEAQESRQRMLSIQAKSARDIAEAELARLVGLPLGTSIQPEARLDPVAASANAQLLVVQALEQRQDRRALLERIGAATLREDTAARGRRPSLAIGGGVDYARPNPHIFPRQQIWKESWDASVKLSWPLFDAGRSAAELAEATASRRALQARLDELDSMVALEVRQRLSEIEASRAATLAADAGLRAATEALRVVNDRFREGVAVSTDVLDAQVMVLQASLDRTQAAAGEHLAEARLQRALGR